MDCELPTVVPIHDERLEAALLGAVLVDQDVLGAVAGIVGVADFYIESHRATWEAVTAIHLDGADVDVASVGAELRRAGRWDEVGGASFLDGLLDACCVSAHPEEHARRIAALGQRRRIATRARILAADADDTTVDAARVSRHIEAIRLEAEEGNAEARPLTGVEVAALTWPDQPEWLIRGWWGHESVGFFGGYEKSSKSVLALSMALSVAQGAPWIHEFETHRGPVLYVAEEDHLRRIQRRIARIAGALGLDARCPDLHVAAQLGVRLTTQRGRGMLSAWIRKIKPVLVVLDPLRRMTPGMDENSSREVGEVLDFLRRMQVESHAGVMVLHHLKKQQGEAGAKDATRVAHRLRGSGDLPSWYDSLIAVNRKGEEMHELIATHRDGAPQQAVHVGIRWDDAGGGLAIWRDKTATDATLSVHGGDAKAPRSRVERQQVAGAAKEEGVVW